MISKILNIILISVYSLHPVSIFGYAPTPWQTGFQEPQTEIMSDIINLHNFVMYILTGILALVLFLLFYVIIRFNKKSNPVPNKFSHNAPLEIIWTLIPVIIISVLAVPTFKTIKKSETIPNSEFTVKIVGYQWYWNYNYPDHGGFNFDSNMIPDDELKPDEKRLLEVDNRLILPASTTIRLLVTGGDVIHSFAVPSFGIKVDAVPGRTNESWIKIDKPGIYYGQCSELCGVNHGFMPIAVEIVSKERFAKWAQEQKNQMNI